MFRSIPRRRAALAALATAAAIPAFAGGAQASLGPVTGTSIPKGQVTLETVGFGFLGTPDGISDVSFMSATSQFTWYSAQVGAQVTGTLHVEGGQNARFRVRVDSLTGNNDVLGTAYDKANGTAVTTASKDIPVDVSAVSAPNMLKARITLEEQGASNKWKSRGDYYTQAVPRTDDVRILSRHIDVGGLGFAGGEPTDDASVTWAVGDDGALTATYRGYMHFSGFAGSGRVVLRAITPFGLPGAETDGATHSSNGNGHDVSAQETLSLTSSSASSVAVVMQSWVSTPEGGYWDDLASQTVSAAE